MNKYTRNYGIDLLRVLLMFMIVLGHLFSHTGIRDEIPLFSIKGGITWGAQAITVCAVNCFALITGYYESTKSKVNFKRIIQLWMLCFFYSFGIYLVFLSCGGTEFSFFDLIKYATPMLSQVYWFFSAYILLMLFAPFINKMLEQLNDRMFKYLLILIIVFFYLLPIFSILFPELDQTKGMSAFALATIYVIGAALKRFDISIKKRFCLIGLFINNAIVLLSKYVLDWIVKAMNMSVGTGLFYHNNTIFQLCNAALLFLLFKQIPINQPKITQAISFVSASVFSIYLIHEHPLMRSFVWSTEMREYLLKTQWHEYIGLTIAMSIAVFSLGLIIDVIRKFFFFVMRRVFPATQKVEKNLLKLEEKMNSSIF